MKKFALTVTLVSILVLAKTAKAFDDVVVLSGEFTATSDLLFYLANPGQPPMVRFGRINLASPAQLVVIKKSSQQSPTHLLQVTKYEGIFPATEINAPEWSGWRFSIAPLTLEGVVDSANGQVTKLVGKNASVAISNLFGNPEDDGPNKQTYTRGSVVIHPTNESLTAKFSFPDGSYLILTGQVAEPQETNEQKIPIE